MLAPKSHVPKKYEVTLDEPWNQDYYLRFKEGITIDGGEKCLPAEFEGSTDNPNQCTLILHEGKFHQVKRMFQTLGNKVVFLKRISIGELDLNKNLALGECMEILHKDVEKLLALKK